MLRYIKHDYEKRGSAVKRTRIKFAVALFLVLASPVIFSCDTKSGSKPIIFINVTLGSGEVPSSTKKIYAVFHLANNWASPWLTLSSDTNSIVIPPLNIGDFPLFFEIIYDFTGSGIPATTGNWYQGWYRKIDRTTPDMSVFLVPEVPIIFLNISMDKQVISITPPVLPAVTPTVVPSDANYNLIP